MAFVTPVCRFSSWSRRPVSATSARPRHLQGGGTCFGRIIMLVNPFLEGRRAYTCWKVREFSSARVSWTSLELYAADDMHAIFCSLHGTRPHHAVSSTLAYPATVLGTPASIHAVLCRQDGRYISWRNGQTTRGTPEPLGSRTRTGPIHSTPTTAYTTPCKYNHENFNTSAKQHLQHGIGSLSKFAIARRLPPLRGTIKHIMFSRAFS